MSAPDTGAVFGWDVGGAHVKACRLHEGRVVDVAEWPCPLWQGLDYLRQALGAARERWPLGAGTAVHAVTMTGEMTDLFEHREDGVARIAATLAEALGGPALRFFGGGGRWFGHDDAAAAWQDIASANWRATASHAAQSFDEGVLVDIGSTTTDLIAFRGGRLLGSSRSDAERLATGELVYQGVVRTPLCALAPRIAWQGRTLNVMNEFFATTADVYRLTGELDPAHDLHPSADQAGKDLPATRRRLARMIGLDARDAGDADWLDLANDWRDRQVEELAGQLARVCDAHRLSRSAVAVGAGCGDFLVGEVLARAGRPPACESYGRAVARLDPNAARDTGALARWAQVCAPSVAVAALWDREQR